MEASAATNATTASANPPLTAKATQCVIDANNAFMKGAPAGETSAQIVKDLKKADKHLIQKGAPCSNEGIGPVTTPGTTPAGIPAPAKALATASNACTGGPYTDWWNINGHTTSSWMLTKWVGYGCWSVQSAGSPMCWPGSSALFYSVSELNCYTDANPAAYATVTHNTFQVFFSFLWANQNWTYSYWEKDFTNGAVQTGCNIC
jgi:hypothetical protein